ncbi:MAG: ABC transporter permease [Spirochaetes bacterium]|nr:ABC transporter permease [Spirochaetota bacterium]
MKLVKKIREKNYPFLVNQFTVTDFKLRYSHSALGYLWSLLNPLLLFGVLYLVFSVFMRFGGVEHYQVYLLSGIMLYTYFNETTSSGMMSLLKKSSLLDKVNFPRIIIPLSSTLTNTITLFLNMVILTIFIGFSKVPIHGSVFFGILTLVELIILALGVSLFLSAFYLNFRDLTHIWGVILQLGFWATPIIYPMDIVPAKYHILFKINPMARLIHNFRMVVIMGEMPGTRNIILNLVIVLFFFGVGYVVFQRRQKYFAEWL